MRASYLLPLFIVICGCQSHPQPKGSNASAASLIEKYQKAKTEKSCELFTELANNKDFSINEVAKLRAQEFCHQTRIEFANYTSWIRPAALNAAVRNAEAKGDQKYLVTLAIEKSKQAVTPEEKSEWAEKALAIAKTTKDETLEHLSSERMYSVNPRLKQNPTEKEYQQVADDARYHREFAKAEQFYNRVIANERATQQEKIAAFKGLRQAFKNTRDVAKSQAINQKLIQYIESAKRASKRDKTLLRSLNEAYVYQVRSLWNQGAIIEAKKLLSQAEKKLSGKWSLSDLFWLRARMAEEKGELDASNDYLKQALAQAAPTDLETKDKLNWICAWNLRRQKNLNGSAAALERLMTETQNDATQHRAAFWLGKTKQEQGKNDEAKVVLANLISEDPLGYYGLLAHNQLGIPIIQVHSQKKPSWTTNNEVQEILHPQIPEDLIATGELELLPAYLDEVVKSYKKITDKTDDVWYWILRYYARAGLYIKLFENLGQMSTDQRKAILQDEPELLFPRVFDHEVNLAAHEMQIEPELIYAIMRQESAYNPRSRSLADAFGLMQVLPEVAHHLGKMYPLRFKKNEDLYEISLNVRVGAALLKEQLSRYKGQFILAVASYNANDQAIQGWMTSRFRGDAMEFIEEIPYDETRNYVRLVMRNLIFYRLLTSGKQTIDFPSSVLKLGANAR
jgi:soluble lytic murein transglycosylase